MTKLAKRNFTDLEDLFDHFMLQPLITLPARKGLAIKTDVDEDSKAFKIKAEIPGVKKEDIEVKINGNQVFIRAEVKQQHEDRKDNKVVRSERYYGEVSRSFNFGDDIDAAGAEAKYEDGVLHLILPKAKNSGLKQLKIR
jgi:HSP20 family protein